MISSVLIYGSIAITTSIFSELSVKLKNNFLRGISILLTLLIPSFFAGVRYGIGTDYFPYLRAFENIKYGYEVRTEIGYTLINSFIAKLGGDIQHVFFVVSFMTVLFIYLALYDHKDRISVGLGMFVFMLLFYQSSYNIVRQMMAAALSLYSIKFIFQSKIIKFIFTIFIAASIHLPSIFLLPIVFIYNILGKKTHRILQILFYIVFLFMVLNYEYIILTFLKLSPSLEYYRTYLENKSMFNIGFGIVVLNLPYILPGLLLFDKLKKYDSRFTFYFILLIMGVILKLSGYFGDPYINRISLYFFIVIIILVPYYFKILKSYGLNILNYFMIIFIVFICIWEFFYLGAGETVPYQWIYSK